MTKNKKLPLILFWIIIIAAFLIRVVALDKVPTSLYWEEVALGYDAYSLGETGADHHGNSWPLLALESFGDWKPSLYFYVAIPFVQIFGLNTWGVRLPSAIAGVLLVAATYLIPKKSPKIPILLSGWPVLQQFRPGQFNLAAVVGKLI